MAEDSKNAAAKPRKKHAAKRRGAQLPSLPNKPVFAPAREAELRRVFHHIKQALVAWGNELVTRGDEKEVRLDQEYIKACLDYAKYYIGFTRELPKWELSQKLVATVRDAFAKAAFDIGADGMPGQDMIWYPDCIEKLYKEAAREPRPKKVAPVPNHNWSPERHLLEKAFADGEIEFRAWAGELISGRDTTVKRPRLSEQTTTNAVMELRFYLGLCTAPDWKPNETISTELHVLFRKLCRHYNLSGTYGQNQSWYHELVRSELKVG